MQLQVNAIAFVKLNDNVTRKITTKYKGTLRGYDWNHMVTFFVKYIWKLSCYKRGTYHLYLFVFTTVKNVNKSVRKYCKNICGPRYNIF